MTGLAEWIIGGLLVLLYAHGRFHTPKTIVGSTTLYRYYLAAVLYYAATLLLFGFLAVLVSSSPQILAALQVGGEGEAVSESLRGVSSPILAALLMTALLPNFPVLSRMDAWMLQLFQDLGNIPLEVRTWRDRLAGGELTIPPAGMQALRKRLAEDPRFAALHERDLRLDPDESPQHQFARVAYLMTVLEDFSLARRKYPRVLEQFQDEYLSVRQRFEQTAVRAARYFNVVDTQDESIAATPPVIELKRSFREHCESVYRDMCQLLARGILMSEPTQRDRRKKLEVLGFHSFEESTTRLDINEVLTVSSVVGLIVFAGIALIEGPGSSTRALFIATMVAVIYGAAVVCALAPKLAWRFADLEEREGRPVAAYLLSGALGVGCAVVVSVMFKSMMLDGGFLAALHDTRYSYPWYLLTFCVAVALAAFADNWGGRSTHEPRWGRYGEGLALAVLLAGVFLVARAMFGEIPGRDPARIPDIRATPVMALIGFFLGVFVPHWYRRLRTARPAGEAQPGPMAESERGRIVRLGR
jgi:hypothetical protein